MRDKAGSRARLGGDVFLTAIDFVHLTRLQLGLMPTPARPNAPNPHYTLLLIVFLLVALFPGLPQYLLLLPYRLLTPSPAAHLYPACSPGCIPADTSNTLPTMSWFQKQFTLPSKSRGSYLITDEVVRNLPEIKDYKVGLLNLFIQHTSCALSLNENWDSDVREDMSDALDRIAPEDRKGVLYRHSAEGPDDMPVRNCRPFRCYCSS